MNLIIRQWLACSLCLGAGLLGWWYFLGLVRRRGAISLVPILLALGLAARIVVALGTPDFYAPDEHSHFNYVRFLAEHRAFPVQVHMTESPTNDWEYYQPPLYYLAQVPVYMAAREVFGDDVHHAMLAMRLFSVALWAMTAWAALRLLKALRVGDDVLTVSMVGMVSLLPSYVFISSSINNDNMALCLGAILLAVMARDELSWRAALHTGLLLGLALLAKFSAVIYGVALVALVGRRQARGDERWSDALGYLAVAAGMAALLLSPWIVRNLLVYGSATAEHVANVPFDWGRFWGKLAQDTRIDIPANWPWARNGMALSVLMLNVLLTFWSVSGLHNNVHGMFPLVGFVFAAVACRSVWRLWRSPPPSPLLVGQLERAFVWAMLLALGVNMALVLRFGLLYLQAQGRFIFPMMLPMALLIGLGVGQWRWCAQNAAAHLGGFFLTYASVFVGFSLATFPRAG